MGFLISIVGPTAVGKTQLAINLAKRYQTEIISCDSRQVYTQLNIGAAKPTLKERAGIPHHFMDFLDLKTSFSAGEFERKTQQLLKTLFEQKQILIAVGGSTLYFHALWYGMDKLPKVSPQIREALNAEKESRGLEALVWELKQCDPDTYEKVDKKNPARVIRALEVYRATGKPISFYHQHRSVSPSYPYQHIKIGLTCERSLLYTRINQRVDAMLEAGLEAEVKSLLEAGFDPELQALKSIGYQEMIAYLQGEISKEEAIRLIKRNSRRYAKRQLTYYRRYEDIAWFDPNEVDKIYQSINQKITQLPPNTLSYDKA